MINDFSGRLAQWYASNHRHLPWRETSDPYAIWLSEIILQQTRVDQGMAYYQRFINQWPDVFSLAEATEQEVLKLWQGLGYYSRARNLHATAKMIVKQHNGIFPSDFDSISKLKGIGSYTAAAIASIAFGLPYPVIDGNVYRFMSRLFGLTEPVNSGSGRKKLNLLLNELIDRSQPGAFNQGLMEFGALQCRPQTPDCISCIFQSQCHAFQNRQVGNLPVRAAKTKVKQRYFNYIIATWEQKHELMTMVCKRWQEDIWKGLFEFPLIETDGDVPIEFLVGTPLWQHFFNEQHYTLLRQSAVQKHVLTHQKIYARFFHLHFTGPLAPPAENNVFLISHNTLGNFPLPRLIDRYLTDYHKEN